MYKILLALCTKSYYAIKYDFVHFLYQEDFYAY
ncbi:unknown [Blautia sp. CAG:237]|nr:unknown [Blautia sp. CAG:237]